MQQLLHHSIFLPLSTGHGGEKRSYQLQIEAATAGYVFTNLDLHRRDKLTLRRLWLAAWLLLRVYGVSCWLSLRDFLRQVRTMAQHYDQLTAFFRDSKEQVFLWESVRPEWYFLLFLAKRCGKKVIAFPHNTESLVPNTKPYLFRISRLQAFDREMEVLRRCDEVYAISHEETWLLSLWGVNARCYLYQPVGEIKAQMTSLRTQRAQMGGKSFFLLLGTAINQPTRVGMQHIIDFWIREKVQTPLHIGGYGTDSLHIPAGQTNLVFLGEMQEQQLVEEQIYARALLVYQPPTTGALTRISEAIEAGIPVIANYAAARSFHRSHGVAVYQDDSELLQIVLTR